MSEFNENEIDKAFRSGIDKMRLVPPPVVWDGVRAKVLQQQVFRYQSLNKWLKILSGIMGVALVGSIYLLENKTLPTAKTIIVTKTDTVYITKTEKVFVPADNKPIDERNNVVHEKVLAQQFRSSLGETKKTKENIFREEGSRKDVLPSKKARITENLTQISNEKNEKKSTINTILDETYPNTTSFQKEVKTKGNFHQETLTTQTSKPPKDKETEGVLSENSLNQNNDFSPNFNENVDRNSLKVAFIEPKLLEKIVSKSDAQLPEIAQKYTEIDFTPHLRIPLPYRKSSNNILDKISISSYLSTDWTRLIKKFDVPNAPMQRGETSQTNYTIGLRVETKVLPNLFIITGFENEYSKFLRDNPSIGGLEAEIIKNKPEFSYETPFGKGFIPTEHSGNKATVGAIETHTVQFSRIPFLLKYNFYNMKLSVNGSNGHELKMYVVGGGFWNFRLKQDLETDIYYDQNGTNTSSHVSITDFQGANQHSFGWNLGLGMNYNISGKWNLYIEPNFKNNITPIFADDKMRTYLSSISLMGGIHYQFGK